MIHGYPPYKYYKAMENSILLHTWVHNGYIAPLLNMPYPNEYITGAELTYLLNIQQSVDSTRLAYITRLDNELMPVWSEYLDSLGVTISADELTAVVEQPYDPLISYLKLWYNRPRPFQIAPFYGIPLYPLAENYHGESAYPGGHTLLSALVAHYVTLRHPALKKDVWHFAMDIKRSREQYGVHYPSDGLFSLQIFKMLKPLWFAS